MWVKRYVPMVVDFMPTPDFGMSRPINPGYYQTYRTRFISIQPESHLFHLSKD